VDHVGAVHDTIRAMLESRGYRVDTVSDAASMRRFLEGVEVDAVILDGSMRGELAQHAKDLRLPLVMISGNHAVIIDAEDLDLQLLRKPFRLQALHDALDEAFASGKFGQREA
jgi:DNA-binding response OmpR family regulator